MASRLVLPFWPTAPDCLAWSRDNIIAVAGGDQIAILSPRLKKISDPDGLSWDHVIVKVNAFTPVELPLVHPSTSANLSIGEELSIRHVLALRWSSSGIGRYGRCVLALLTTDHVLSIWECEGRPNARDDWKRKLVVNSAVRKYLASSDVSRGGVTQVQAERLQVQQRIRAFDWSPPIHTDSADDELTPFIGRGHQLLAVSTESGKVLLLRVWTPRDVLHPEIREWSVEVIYDLPIASPAVRTMISDLAANGPNAHLGNFEKPTADFLAFGPGRQDTVIAPGTVATLAFIANNKLSSTELHLDSGGSVREAKKTDGSSDRQHVVPQADMTGPLAFCHSTGALVAFTAETVYHISPAAQEGRVTTAHHLDGRWDGISGLSFVCPDKHSTQLHIVSHLSSASAPTAALTLPLHEGACIDSPLWQAAINEERASYSAEHDIGGRVQERTWGIASSPLGDYVATCLSLHPSDSVAYTTQSEQQCVLSISTESGDEIPLGRRSALDHISADVLFFSMQRFLERQAKSGIFEGNSATDLAERLLQTGPVQVQDVLYASSEHVDVIAQGEQTVDTLVRHLKLQLFLRPDLRRARFENLSVLLTGKTRLRDSALRQILRPLCSEVLRLFDGRVRHSEKSSKIRQAYTMLQAKLDPAVMVTNGVPSPVDSNEACRICHQIIPFESVKWARCSSGHQFTRCALTLLAIQEPGLTKQCIICAAQYLDETKLPELVYDDGGDVKMTDLPTESVERAVPSMGGEHSQPDDSGWVEVAKKPTEPPKSIARILFAACDTCVYCGGGLSA